MGIWIELGVFLVALAFGVWQLHDVKKAQAERRMREQAASSLAPEQGAERQPASSSQTP